MHIQIISIEQLKVTTTGSTVIITISHVSTLSLLKQEEFLWELTEVVTGGLLLGVVDIHGSVFGMVDELLFVHNKLVLEAHRADSLLVEPCRVSRVPI